MKHPSFDLKMSDGQSSDYSQIKATVASSGEERKVLIRHKHYYLEISEGKMPTYPVEQFKKEWIMERLQYAMVEALFKQGLLTEAQRRELCRILKCDILNSSERR